MIQTIIEYFLGPTDPTKGFDPVDQETSLCWDFDSKSLNGIKFGDPIESLARFGPADRFEKSWIDGSLCFTWSKPGLFIDFQKERSLAFDYFGVLVGPDKASEQEIPINYGSLSVAQGNLVFDSQSTRSQFDGLFGEPSKIENDAEEHIRYYLFDGIEYEFEFDSDNGPLKRINIYPEI